MELRLSTPPVIFDGDRVRVAGSVENGVFSALACRNLTTGWLSPAVNTGCVSVILVAFVIFSLIFGIVFAIVGGGILSLGTGQFGLRSFLFLPLGMMVPGLATWGLISINRNAGRVKLAREMLG
ncbi:MAG TPA: hypothetical protein VF258_08915 [Luteolibacter sp.]